MYIENQSFANLESIPQSPLKPRIICKLEDAITAPCIARMVWRNLWEAYMGPTSHKAMEKCKQELIREI